MSAIISDLCHLEWLRARDWLLNGWRTRRLEEMLFGLAHSADALREIARTSFRHPNGFRCLPIVESTRDEPAVRLHHWFAGRSVECDIHDHPWDYHSLVIAGRLTMTTYAVDVRGQLCSAWRCARDRADHVALTPAGVAQLRELTHVTLGPGTHYQLSSRELHRAQAGPTGAITVVLRSRYLRNETRVFRPTVLKRPSSTTRTALDLAEVRCSLLEAADGLRRASLRAPVLEQRAGRL